MKEHEFMAIIGYQGTTAIVDKKKMGKIKGKELSELLDMGEYKPALCQALYRGDEGLLDQLRTHMEGLHNTTYDVAAIKRLFGVSQLPEGIEKVKAL